MRLASARADRGGGLLGASAIARERITALRGGVTAEGQAADLAACASWDNPAGLGGIACPLLVMTASHDPLFDEGVAYARALEAAGVPVRLARARGHTHTSVTMVDVVISGAPVRAGIGEALRDFFPSAEPQEQVS